MAVDVSIIIVSWNTKELLRDCLRSVYRETAGVALEVIVVDNGSTDHSAEMVAMEFPEARVVRNTENRGFAAANNQGIALAQGRFVLLLNSDTRLLDSTVSKALAFADAHPDVAVVGCRTIFPDGRLQYNCFMFPSLLNLALSLTGLSRLLRRSRVFGRQRMTWWNYDTPRVVDAVAGCFMLVRRQAIDEVGSMAECYFMYSEDTDWCWRFKRRGWKTMYTPDAVIVHIRAASSSQSAVGMHLLERRSMLMFLEKKSGRLTRWAANAMFLAGSLVKLPFLALRRLGRSRGAEAAYRQWQLSVAALSFHLRGRLPGAQ